MKWRRALSILWCVPTRESSMASAATGPPTALYLLSSLAPPVLPPVYQALSPAPDSQHDQLSTGPCKTPIKLCRCLTSPSFRSKVYATLVKTCARRNTVHLHPLCAQRTSLRSSDSPDKAQHLLSPPKLRIPIPYYTSYKPSRPLTRLFPG